MLFSYSKNKKNALYENLFQDNPNPSPFPPPRDRLGLKVGCFYTFLQNNCCLHARIISNGKRKKGMLRLNQQAFMASECSALKIVAQRWLPKVII